MYIKVNPGRGGLSCLQAGTWSTPALCDVIICRTNKRGYGLRMYSYNAYIHSRIHILFYVSSLIIRSISVCCVRVVMRMCLRQHDTTQKPGSQPSTCASVLTYAVQGYKFICIGFRESSHSYPYQSQMLSKPDNPPPAKTESDIQCLDHTPAAYLPPMVLMEIPDENGSYR